MAHAFTLLLFDGMTWWWLLPLLVLFVLLVEGQQLIKGYRCFITRILRRTEVWLPIVDDVGNVVGKVPQCVSLDTPGRYQHPVVRVLVWHQDKLFLRPRSIKTLFEQGMVDLPLEKVLDYGENTEEVLATLCGRLSKVATPRFLLKYKHENQEGRWLVLLYVLPLSDKGELEVLGQDGKFWPLQQIKANSGKAFFSRILEGEIQLFSDLLFDADGRFLKHVHV